MKRVTVVMPPELHKLLKYISFEQDKTMNDLILTAVRMYISNEGYKVNNFVQPKQ